MERIDVLTCRPGSVVQVLSVERTGAADVAGSPVRRDARIVAGNDIVHAEFKFLARAGELTIEAGISPIGLKSSDPDFLRKQIQGVPCP